MPQTKFSQQQQIIQHTSHSINSTSTISNPQHHLHQQPQHVQQINLAAPTPSIHHQTHQHHSQQHQQPTTTAHMIQVSEEFLEQAANNHNSGSMMISTTGEVINQQQIFKIVSTDGTTGNMIIDATNQNSNTTTTSKVLLSNLTVLSKQPSNNAQGQIIANHQQQNVGQTINFVNAKNFYSTSTASGNISGVSKPHKFAVATANVGNYKSSSLKQSSSLNTQYLQQTNSIGQQKINVAGSNRSVQMLTTTRVQNSATNSTTPNLSSNNNSIAVISNNPVPAQTMVLQQPQKFITNSATGSKVSTTTVGSSGGNLIKKSTTPTGTLRMNNSHNTSTATKLMNNLQTTPGVKSFITQSPNLQQQTQQLTTFQQHTTKSGSKSKFVKQYNNAILNSAGAVAIATLPHQQPNNLQIQQQQQHHHQQQSQTPYINHHKNIGSATKINKISSKYAQSTNMAAQLPSGTQLHQKSIIQSQQQQQQIQTTNSNSNIKFVNAQGTVIQQQQQHQTLTPQKLNNKHHQQHHLHQQPQYQNVQNFDTIDGSNVFHQANTNALAGSTSTLPLATTTTTGSTLLTDDIMMVNGTQMTDELSARILQSMSQKSFNNQRYHQQQQQHVFQSKNTTTATPASVSVNSISNNNNNNINSNGNMLPPPSSSSSTQNTIVQTNNSSNILLSPREYTLYPTAASSSTIGSIVSANLSAQQQQHHSSPIHYNNNLANPTVATASSNIIGGSFSPNNFIAVSNNSSTMTSVNTHTSVNSIANSSGSTVNTSVRQAQSAPGSRSQSMERKLHESSMSRKSSEYYKVNNHNSLRGSSSHHNNIVNTATSATQASGSLGMTAGNMSGSISNLLGVSSSSTLTSPLPVSRPQSLPPTTLIMEPQAQVIHLQTTKTLPGANTSSNDDDDDIIGEEVRPAPVETEDIRLRILHAVLFDHTYVNPMPSELPTSFAVQLPPVTKSSATTSNSITSAGGHNQQWSLGGIGAITSAGSGNASQQNYALYGSQSSRLHKEVDSYAGINNNSGLIIGDIDPGEETETAPEAELEDDSVTRCICDLTHDDGYMICCDKCCAWQHVDCMGIDRQNIPDEYLCEVCQPRIVDKARARSLQLMKRKEQQQQLMLTTQAQSSVSAGTMGAAGSANGGIMSGAANLLANDLLSSQQRLTSSNSAGFNPTGNMSTDAAAIKLLAVGGNNIKKNKMLKKAKDGVSGKRTKKAEKLAAAAAAGLSTSSKPGRKETKKNTKRKKAGAHDGNISTVGMTAAEKHAANLRQWIENYELAVTNHYSPELRARLHAISKQPSLLQSILNTENPILKAFSNGSLDNRATTVPHAGGKILISNLDIVPNSPICELRGKYMLTTQYKTQNTSMNMNSPPPNNYHLTSYKPHKTPGPFIFFYQLPGSEVASSPNQLIPQTTTTTILNPDGTYTTTTTTLPAQQSPPTFLKGPEICVDTRTYGNEARFVRRSCRPNAEIQHLFEKGTIHLFIVALTDIRASTEITVRHEPHDLLAIDNKKSTTMIIQPTSTPCACGLTKDCVFGPPIPQLPPTAKSNAGRKSLANSASVGNNTGNLTAKQRKANQQNLNRNRSISSSASGDSNMGVNAAANIIAMSLNSPNNINKMPPTNKISNSNTLMPLSASCNSNLSNASSSSSTLTSAMHDSGVCTSSSSPSVSIPSPTQNLHSPIQQQQPIHQQQVTQQLMHNSQIRTTVQLLPQQQQQQIMQSLPTPLVLPSRNISYQQQQPHSQKQHPILQQPPIILQQQQPLNVISTQSATKLNSGQDNKNETEQKHSQMSLCAADNTSQAHPQVHSFHQRMMLHEQSQVEMQPSPQPTSSAGLAASSGLLETVSPEATIAAVALQSLNASHSPNTSIGVPSTLPVSDNNETHLQAPQTQQEQQFLIVQPTEISTEHLPQQISHQPSNQSSENKITYTSATSLNSSPHQSPQQQYKSPQKNNHSQNSGTQPPRKTPGKHARATSFSEDNDQHSEDNSLNSTPTSSTPKEKPKLSREDRKMEAILRAIEKMERNQQKQKQAKRQNSSGSHNTTPTSPNKTFESGESSGASKRSNSNAGATGRSKKKRKAGAKGSQGGGYNNQRKRRQSRMNSQESVEDCNQQDHDPITSESDGCTVIHSPSLQTNASLSQPQFSTSTASSTSGSIITSMANESSNTVDQAAGLLMAFANPNISPVKNNTSAEIANQRLQQSPHHSSSEFMIPPIEVAASSSPPTPASQVSSACLLIEAAVGPLESNLDSNNTEIHNSEFKYPLQAKTKKHLMNNWLHQAEDLTADNNVSSMPEQTLPNMQTITPNTLAVCNSGDGIGVSVVSRGLDSLLQAAMSDLTQSQSVQEQPQNLSIAAQKVEEFIQQTESSSSACSLQSHTRTKHSFEYEQQPHHQRTYVNLPTPAVDLTLKTPLTIGPPNVFSSTEHPSNNRNLNLPLQVSSCSNNSSVKKRWLRQAISEETHEEFQQAFVITSSPTIVPINNFSNSQPALQTATFSPAASVSHFVPNGFTTPLKKRRLLLAGKDDVDENVCQSGFDLCTNVTPSSPTPPAPEQQQQQNLSQMQQTGHMDQASEKDKAQVLSRQDDADIHIEKHEIYRTQIPQNQVNVELKTELSQDLQYSKVEKDQEEDVDVTTSTPDNAPLLQNEIKREFKHENDVVRTKVKEERLDTPAQQQLDQTHSTEFNDQDDDVDILRSPSPGREMIKAEDNLVKIEPEDTSGMEDIKIDVEREEESITADDVIVIQSKEHNKDGEDPILDVFEQDDQSTSRTSPYYIEVKKEIKTANASENNAVLKPILKKDMDVVENQPDSKQDLIKATQDESHGETDEPKAKRIKLEKSLTEEENVLCVKKETQINKEKQHKAEESNKEAESYLTTKEQTKEILHSVNKEDRKVIKTEAIIKEKNISTKEIDEVSSSVSSTLLAVKINAADTFTALEPATPPPPQTSAVSGGTAAPIQRNKSLSDDDIQARLHSFHKENILFLQSRNKKTKSSSSLTSNSTSNCLVHNSDQNKSRTSSSSHHQHHHHHHHEGKEKSDKDKLSFKHHKSSSATQLSGSTKKHKLHKRERTATSSSSNIHKSSINSQLPPSSSSSYVSNKNTIISSTSTSSSSLSKKLKSLKKSSSGSSTSSIASLSAASLTPQTSSMCSSSTASLEKEKDKHNRQRITSTPNGNGNIHALNTPNYPSSKKRQLNFELELTKDLHLLNSAMTGGSKHKKDTSRLLTDDQGHVSTKKARKDSNLTLKEELKNGSNKNVKIEKQHDRKSSNSIVVNTFTKQITTSTTASSQPTTTPAINTLTSTMSPNTLLEEPKLIPTIAALSTQSSLISAPILREHPTLPHFNNVVLGNNGTLLNYQQILLPSQPVLTSAQSQPTSSIPPQSIPNQKNSPDFVPTVQEPSVPSTPPPSAVISVASSPLSTQSVNPASHLPFYNTIYGKLLDNSTAPPSLATPLTASNTTTPTPLATGPAVPPTSSGVLLDYLDTKLKNYNTLSGYISHSAMFGLSSTNAAKDTTVSSVGECSSTISAKSASSHVKDSCSEMPAPLAPASNNAVTSSTSTSAAIIMPLKIHTKTASHDPRLNPQLTAPEPPPQPKRKLSINEYRKRMQQSSSNDSIGSSLSLSTTPTSPPTSLESSSMLDAITNKCTLYSPDRLTQSVDSQIQKEIMSSTSAVTSSSSSESLNSSNSSTGLNDALLKSSSFVEEDSTKGQFNAAPTLLEKQQESLCARLKSLKEKQSLGTSFNVGAGNRSRFSSFSENVSSDFGLRKDEDEMDNIRSRNLSISSSVVGGDLLDNCLEEISSTSTSMSSSREQSPDRSYTSHHHKILTASATATTPPSHSNNVQTTRHHQTQQHHQEHNITCDTNELNLERKRSVDIA